MSLQEIERLDRFLVNGADTAFRTSAAAAGAWLECRPGCSECCLGPFPITLLDARRLKRGIAALESEDPERATAVRLRARAAISAFVPAFPGDPWTGILRGEVEAEDSFMSLFAGIPCPALDPASQSCELYEWRPISCRTFGPPVRIGGEDLPPCRLCFSGASSQEVESCRVEVDPDDVERRALLQIEAPGEIGNTIAETLVAFAVAGADSDARSGPSS